MKIQVESKEIPHPRERVYEALLNPQILSGLMPGVEKFEEVEKDTFDVQVKLGVGALRGNYTGRVQIVDRNPPESYKLQGEAKGTPGWARGVCTFTLKSSGEGTRVTADADAQVGGRIAGVGQRMTEGVAKSMAREFFQSLEQELAGTGSPVGQFRFGFRVFLGMIRDFFARLFGRGDR